MLTFPFSPWPCFTQDEADAVTRVLLSNRVNYWTGDECKMFENEFASWVGCEYAITLANGTVALELALKSLNIEVGDEIVVTPRTFMASASSIVAVGACPVFADVDPESQNITAETIRAVLTPRTKAIICVHLAGLPCDMDPIMALACEQGLKVIEDCAQAHGARYKGRSVGSIGHVGAWSFCQDKIMTTGGEGGLVTTNDKGLWSRMWSYKDHGKSWEAVYDCHHPPGFRWLHETFGTNWRMTEMQAAIGCLQLKKMSEWTRQRQENAAHFFKCFNEIKALRVLNVPAEINHAYYKYYVFIRPEMLKKGWGRDKIINDIVSEGIPCFSGTCSEIYLEKAFVRAGIGPKERLPIAKMLGETSLMFLVHPTLSDDAIKATCRAVEKVMHQASK